jgi:uncharacterized protein (DUF2267 family)
MSATGLPVFELTLEKTNAWLDRLMSELGIADRHLAYRALRATLHALRDRISVDEAAHLGAQLPLLVRGVYYEGWHPAGKPLRERSREEFLSHVQRDVPQHAPEPLVRATFAVLSHYVTAGEISDILGMLPAGVRELWPSAPTASAGGS